tara:strand:+ start:382 stop:783 length:402 start_codon:yes stop_codon:yes gene_type:complete
MSTNRRSYPNDYFAWYNDDDSLAIVWRSLVTDSDKGTKSGEFDTYTGEDVADGIRITYHGHYSPINSKLDQAMADTKLEAGLMPSLVCYLKARLYEDLGDFQKAIYFKQMFTRAISQYPLRKSGVRTLSVPKL